MRITPIDGWIRQKIGASQPDFTRQTVENWQLSRLNETLALAQLPQPLGLAWVAAKVENCLAIFFAPQAGHFEGVSESVRARCSNVWPHAEHVYSKIGMA